MRTRASRSPLFKVVAAGLLILCCATAKSDILDRWATNQVSTGQFGLTCVAYGNGRFVAYGEYSDWGVIMSSEDGSNWTLRSDGNGSPPSGLSYSLSLEYTGGRFFALGGFGTSGMSTDGINWTIFSFPNYSNARGIAYSPAGRYVAVGDAGWISSSDLNIFTSSNGITWTARNSTSPNGSTLQDVAYGAGRFVALDGTGRTYLSTLGTLGAIWTQGTIPTSPYPGGNQISFANGVFMVPQAAGTNLVSTDGIIWVARQTGLTNLLGKVRFANGMFMARAGIGSPVSYLATSADGTNWVQYASILPGAPFGRQPFTTDGKRFIAVGSGPAAGSGPPYPSGFVYLSEDLADIEMTGTAPPQGTLAGLAGRTYRIEHTDTFVATGTNNWQVLGSLQLTNKLWHWSDATASNSAARFYRGVLLP